VKVKLIEGSLKEELLKTLRDEKSRTSQFKEALRKLGLLLISEALKGVKTRTSRVKTPISQAEVREIFQEVVFIPILRAGLSLLLPALEVYPESRVGFIGVYRDEESLEPVPYYEKFPLLRGALYVLLDPMVATGGTAEYAVRRLTSLGVKEKDITFVSVVSAPEALRRLERFKEATLITASVDEGLNDKGFIVPGLGDAGDRFCGTLGVEVIENYGIQGS